MALVKKSKRFVGLYLTADRIEAAMMGGDPHAPEIETQYVSELAPDLIDPDGAIMDPAGLAAELKRFWKEAGLKTRRVVLALDSRKALLRQIRLPKMPINSLDQAILSEAEQFALFRDEEPLIDYFVNELEHEFLQATYGVITKELVTSYTKTLKQAGLTLHALDLAQLAGQRGMEYYHPLQDTYWTGVMVQPQRLIISFWMDGRLTVMREIILPERMSHDMAMLAQSYLPNIAHSVASDLNFFDEPCMVLACDRVDDARALAEHAQTLLQGEVKVAGPEPGGRSPRPAAVDPFGPLDDAPIEGGFGDALDAAFDAALEGGVKTVIPPAEEDAEDEEEDDFDEEAIQVSYIALGAALWDGHGVVPSLNLMPKGKLSHRKTPKLKLNLNLKVNQRVLAGVAIALLLSSVLSGWLLWQKKEREDQVKTLMRQLADMQVQIQGTRQMTETQPPEAEMLRQWMPNYQENLFARRMLDALREHTPSDAWVSSIAYTVGRRVVIQGGALSQTSCLHFADQISGLERIQQVRVIKLEKSSEHYVFEVRAELSSTFGGGKQP